MLRLLTLFAGAILVLASIEPVSAQDRIRIVALGDSLTAGYQLPPEDAFPAQLQVALQARGHAVDVINAGVSGDTTAGGLARLDWSVGPDTDAVIVELGANDALRGLPVSAARRNLDEIVRRLSERDLPVLVAGMRAPRNMGDAYASEFDAIFPEVAQAHGALLYPFFLEGIPISSETVLPDGIHPTGKGVAVIVEKILPSVEQLIKRVEAARS